MELVTASWPRVKVVEARSCPCFIILHLVGVRVSVQIEACLKLEGGQEQWTNTMTVGSTRPSEEVGDCPK